MNTKVCSKCGQEKPTTEFRNNRSAKDGLDRWCKPCASESQKKYYQAKGKDYLRERQLKVNYGISIIDYDEMFEEQDGCCAICGDDIKTAVLGPGAHFSVDHDHETGNVRGLLCMPCNIMLGKAKDNPNILRSGASYLENRRSNG